MPRYGGSYPWVRDIWEEMQQSNTEVSVFREGPGYEYNLGWAAQASVGCTQRVNAATGLPECTPSRVIFGQRGAANSDYTLLHELAHLHTQGNDNADYPGPLGIGFVYLHRLPGTDPRAFDGNRCYPSELYADLITLVTMNTANGSSRYWDSCFGAGPGATRTEALGVVRSVLRGEMPSWLANTYGTAGGGLDRERLWTHVKALPAFYVDREPVVMLLRNAFGGYCNTRNAASSAFRGGPTRDPWRDGGCVPEAPGAHRAVAGDASIAVSWEPPAGDGGAPIEGYKVQWRSGSEDHDAARESVVSDPDARAHTLTGLEAGIYRVRVVAYNTNGDGAPTAEATANARDRLAASFPETAHSDAAHTGPGDRPAIVVSFNRPVQPFNASTPSVETTGGTVESVAAHGEAGLANAYRFTLRPAGDAPVVFRLRTGRPCASGGICSALGSTLSEAPAARTLPGPGPVLRSAEVDGGTLALTFDEALDEGAVPGAGDFAVSDEEVAVTAVSIRARKVTLTLRPARAASDGAITVRYAPPPRASKPRLRDLAGNPAPGFAGQSVTNRTPLSSNADLAALAVYDDAFHEQDLDPSFRRSATRYRIDVGHAVERIAIAAVAAHPYASVAFDPADAAPRDLDHHADLAVGSNTITITVTAEDGSTTEIYTLTVRRSTGSGPLESLVLVDTPAGIDLAALSDGAVVDVQKARTDEYGWRSFTIRAEPVAGAEIGSVKFRLLKRETAGTAGQGAPYSEIVETTDDAAPWSLSVRRGGMRPGRPHRLTVTAYPDAGTRGTALQHLDIEFTLKGPRVTIEAGPSPVTEGTPATFTVRRTGVTTGTAAIDVQVSETGAMLDFGVSSTRTVRFNRWESSVILSVHTQDDLSLESASTVTAALQFGLFSPYTQVPGEDRASVTVLNDDTVLDGIALVDTTSQASLLSLHDGAVIDLEDYATAEFGFRALGSPRALTGSVSFDLWFAGHLLKSTTDSTSPYSLTGAALRAGSYRLLARAWSGAGRTGTVLRTLDMRFTVRATEVSIAAGPSPVTEGTAAAFTLSRTGRAARALTVAVSVTETRAMLAGSPPATMRFGPGESSKTLSVATHQDRVVEAANTVTAAITTGAGYRVSASAGSAGVTVEDDDRAAFGLSVSPARIAEGESSTVTVAITNGITFAEVQAIALTVAGGTAAKGTDYTIAPETPTLEAGRSSVTATVTALDDTAEEPDETIVLAASHGGARIGTREIILSASDAPGTPVPTPLSVEFPRSIYASPLHRGTDDRPQVIVAFSEAVASFRPDSPSVEVIGAAVLSVRPHREAGLTNGHIFFLDPAGSGPIVFNLLPGRSCASGGICTAGGTVLSVVPAAHVVPDPAATGAPVITSPCSLMVDEGETAVATLTATDADTATERLT